ncbi:MAG: DUF4249 domain-containing protein [Saprospiraceae bacterium]|nr:DUF4249 domain-containing protein [Saprospiraceae bacterium]
MKKNIAYYFILLGVLFNLVACEEEVVPDNSDFEEQYVIESYLENSTEAFPPYLFLTKSIGFYSKIDVSILQKLFVSGADVKITVDNNVYKLDEICLNQLPEEIRKEILVELGLNSDSVQVDLCAYIDINRKIPIAKGKIYELEVVVRKDTIRSTTRIPDLIPLDSIWFDKLPGKPNDTFAQMFARINDIPDQTDYYRFFTAGQDELLIPDNSSVFNDFFFNGQNFKFTIPKARPAGEGFSDTAGYFRKGDTVRVKWCNIDREHFDFWNTLEVSRTRQGPFSSYVRIDGNIQNGLGLFGGQNCETYTILVK